MKEVRIPCIFLLIWGLEINGDTFEVLTIPYEEIFPNGHPYKGQNYQTFGYQEPQWSRSLQPQRSEYQHPQRLLLEEPQKAVYQTQRAEYGPNYLNYQQPDAGVSNTDWVCRNPSSGDTLIISSDNLPLENIQNLRQQPHVPNVRTIQSTEPVQPQQPSYLQQNLTPQTPNQNPNSLIFPNPTPTPTSTSTSAPVPTPTPINCNTYPQHPMCGETIILGTQAPEKTTNTNGEGIINIR